MSILGLVLALLGVLGSVIPFLPGPIISFLAIIVLYTENMTTQNAIIFFGLTAIMITILGSIVPVLSTKLTGASKYGLLGSAIGTFLGIIFFPPIGAFLGAFFGAILGELYILSDIKKAINSSYGAIIGTLLIVTIQIVFSVSVFIYTVVKIINIK